MLLALDIGNSHCVLGLFEHTPHPDAKLLSTWRISTHPLGTEDELLLKVASLFSLQGFALTDLKGIALASVVPVATERFRRAFTQNLNRKIPLSKPLTFYEIDARSPFLFQISPEVPRDQVGADRLVNAEAAVAEYGAPAIIVDSGTATTLCAISADGKYLGGAILPGMEMAAQALTQKTAKLFAVEFEKPVSPIGTNTRAALQSGMVYGYASMIDGMVRRFKETLGLPKIPVIGTGGVSFLLQDVCKEVNFYDPDLTLKGIRQIYRRWHQAQHPGSSA